MKKGVDKLDDGVIDAYERSLYFYGCGVEAMQEGDYGKALDLFNCSLDWEKHSKTYERMHTCYKHNGREELAFKAIQSAYALNPRVDKTAFIYANELKARGETDAAREVAQEIRQRNPTYRTKELEKLL